MESSQHPVQLTNEEGLERSRLTVFFRLLLALPHIVWFGLWSVGVLFVLIFNWFATLFRGTPPLFCHKFLTAYVRYSVHLAAYVSLTGDKFPDFVGRPGSYAIDAHMPEEPQLQNRWKTGFRAILAIPAWLFDAALVGGSRSGYSNSGGVLWTNAFLAWWACLFTGRMPEGLRDLNLYALRYSAQTHAYTLLVTDRYPDADPFVAPTPAQAPYHPVRLPTGEDDLTRSRLTVFFRILLVIPHLVWLFLWGIVAFFAAVLGWFATLFSGQLPEPFHNFLTRYVRYGTHVIAFLILAGGPFPGFGGAPGSYPIDVDVDPRARQNRWKTGFRLVLAVPAAVVSGAVGAAGFIAAIFAWWVALFTGRMPRNLRQAQLLSLRYSAQLNGYALLLTDRYPFASPAPPAAEQTTAAIEPTLS
jgi:Domain of unknown function (DUF4389)